jgi:hypothetical protein
MRQYLTRIRTSWASFDLIVLDAAVIQRLDQPGHVVLVELGEELVAFAVVRGPRVEDESTRVRGVQSRRRVVIC